MLCCSYLILWIALSIFSTKAYIILPDLIVDWNTAQAYCQDLGTSLASLHSFEDVKAIQSVATNLAIANCFIGGSHDNDHTNDAFYSDCTYTWIDGSPWDYEPPFNVDNGIPYEYCQYNEPYTCILGSQSINFGQNNTLHQCPDFTAQFICNDS